MKVCLQCQSEFESSSWDCPDCSFEPESENGFLLFSPKLNHKEEGFNLEAFKKLHSLEAKNFWFRVRNQLITWGINKYFQAAESFLEIGCGTGFVLSEIESQFPTMRCAGSEIHTAGLEFANSRLEKAPLWQMDARQIPFENEFDLVGAFDVIEHIKEDEVVLAQMFQAVRPGGGILLTVPQHPSLWSDADVQACHERRYTKRELRQKVENAGFEIVRTTSFVTLLLPFMAVSRMKEKFSEANPETELDLPPRLNAFFETVMGFESFFIRFGINLPAGGSLLLAAKKPE